MKIRSTKYFTGKYFYNPNRNNLYGLSKELSYYNLNTYAVQMSKDDKRIYEIDSPFVAHLDTGFVLVTNMTGDKVECFSNKKTVFLDFDSFINSWTGVILLLEAGEVSKEVDYEKNRKNDIAQNLRKYILILSGLLLLVLVTSRFDADELPYYSVTLLFNLLGVFICSLLLFKQLPNMNNLYADFCTLLSKNSSCNHTANHEFYLFRYLISLPELGMGYFVTNIFVILFDRELSFSVFYINLLLLPFTVGSLWYQKVIDKKFCMLCVLVQGTVWGLFLISLIFGIYHVAVFEFIQIAITSCLYLISVMAVSLISGFVVDSYKLRDVIYEFNKFKFSEDVFNTVLKKSKRIDMPDPVSVILLGNKVSKHLVTVVTNPFCTPCAKMHEKIDLFISMNRTRCKIQFVFISANKEHEDHIFYLISCLGSYPENEFIKILDEWYRDGKNNPDKFCKKYPAALSENASSEFDRHKNWVIKNEISKTPTILIDGYELPAIYTFEDINFMI